MKLIIKEQQEEYENVKICYICKLNFQNKYVKDIVIIQGNREMLGIVYVT